MPDRLVVPLSVWPTGQHDALTQVRAAACVPGTETDTERVPPAVAAHTIATYTRPGDLVLDPNCGAGTVLTEALRAGRHAVGLTSSNRWWPLARANVTAAKSMGAWRDGSVLDARPTVLATVRAAGLIGQVGLVLTALRTPSRRLSGSDHDPDESALAELATALRCCEPLVRQGGYVVVVARPKRCSDGALVDLASQLDAVGTAAGLALIDRCVALTADLRGERLRTRASLAERRRSANSRVSLVAHDEVFVFQLSNDAELAVEAVCDIDARGWRRAA
ncbi:hypothetical protein GCM10011609_17120 [Lentzea pudingi]|uniref:DNA methylase N-4/N-6 domain-containing protein n=1 Tax=Lentzea pudingi TaxID=1789439 RepID=A0ABQ2HHB2_9PSEU|nr:DNA methyltransferase [Lentzea pudingi]GGM81679.1 hypothetical protein GCM10011609_17120 [Lentzea pudingi]